MNRLTNHKSLLLAALLAMLGGMPASADDTEIFLKQSALSPDEIRPNVVFILDTSGSMGQPIDTAQYGDSRFQEEENYDPNIVYEGFENNNGGIGDDDYLYFYDKPNTFADQYIYYNKVHKDQLATGGTCPTLAVDLITSPAPYFFREVVFVNSTNLLEGMCNERDASCNFITGSPGTSGVNGDLIGCLPGFTGLHVVNANFHNYLQGYYRYTVLERVMRDLFDVNYDINMSLMRFNGGSGGYVIHESVQANDTTGANQASLESALNNIYEFNDSTPLTESVWESVLYLKGDSDYYGHFSGSNTTPAAYSSGSNYKSPIEYECQKSHIVLLTDGAPTSDTGRDSAIEGSSYTGSNCSGNCLDEFAEWIRKDGFNNRDHSGLDETQDIKLHTIGFGAGADPVLLSNAANNADGIYKAAANADELFAAFTSIVNQTQFEKDTFVAPAVAVNSYTGLQHRDELYFALFQPSSTPRWTGNIKKYKLINGKITDNSATPKPAIDAATGYFDPTALSYWTTPTDWNGDGNLDPDGSNIANGGFAYELDDPDARKLYTYIGTPLQNTGSTPTPYTLSAAELSTSNTGITTDLLGLGASTTDSEAERITVLNWARGGLTGTPPPNYYVGDLIHNRPSVVTYGTTVTKDVNEEVIDIAFDDTIYAASNLGFLHALDAESGQELFGYIPQELLPNLEVYYNDAGTFSDKVYGLDAPMTIWRQDTNENGSVVQTVNGIDTPEADDHVYIYQGMRRGGSNLYALDVSRRQSPKLLWQIDGEAYDASPSGDFRDLAQTWSVPQLSKIQVNCSNGSCVEKDVLFFGGGYDTVHDTATTPTTGDKGNAIYMVDATTGALLWSAGKGSHHDLNLSNMENSIPANVTVADIDGDTFADYLFAVDIQGNVWRIDFDETASSPADYAFGGKIAELGGSSTNFRRFYNAPDVAYFTERGFQPFLTVSIASGYRASPNNTDINDYLFVLYDGNAGSRPIDSSGDPLYDYVDGTDPITFSDLGTTATRYGWYKALTATGEKGLSRTITFGDQILMTTFIPSLTAGCEGSEGTGRYYLLDAFTGASRLATSQPYANLAHGGIPPEPAIIFTSDDICTANCGDGDDTNDVTEKRTDLVVCVGTECIDDVLDQTISKSFWREN
jgi:type IV pilus assembly protein PilY1